MEIFYPLLDRVRVKRGTKLLGSSYIFSKTYIQNFTPLVPFLHVEKFVMVGFGVGGVGGRKNGISVLSFKSKPKKTLAPKLS